KELAPRVKRVAVIHQVDNPASAGYLATIAPAAPAFGVELTVTGVRNTADIERAIDAIAGMSDSGIIVLPGPLPRRDRIIALAETHRLPFFYPFRYGVVRGGLPSCGIDNVELSGLAGSYVDRTHRGEKRSDLPEQPATKSQLVINLKPPRALGLDPPIALLAR